MPQLVSGRHFGILPSGLRESLSQGSDEQRSYVILAVRMYMQSLDDLAKSLQVAYFGEGGPPDAAPYLSGFIVQDVLDGKADWSDSELAEFRHWLATDVRLRDWLQMQIDEIDEAIRNSSVWESPLWNEP